MRIIVSDKFISKSIKKVIKHLEQGLKKVEEELTSRINSNADFSRKRALLESFKGIGSVTSSILVSQMPDLGNLNGKEIASLAGVAPHNRDSGKYKGKRCILSGRSDVRSALFLVAFSVIRYNLALKEFYERLVKVGKKKKLAIVACMRKIIVILNAMIRTGKPWETCYLK